MKRARLILAAALLSLVVAACSSSKITYPDPGDDDDGPDPQSGMVVGQLP